MGTRRVRKRKPRVKPPGATTAGDWGYAHQQARKRYIALLRDGDPCARCRVNGKYHPIYRSQIRKLHLDHNDTRTGYIGLSAAACNCADGARKSIASQRGNARRRQQAQPIRYSRVW